jgi:hypothetical protein
VENREKREEQVQKKRAWRERKYDVTVNIPIKRKMMRTP